MAAKAYTEDEWSFPRPDCTLRGVQFLPKKKARSAVLLLHGFCMNSNQLRAYAKELAAKGYLCIAYDARGHGRSGGRLDIPAMVEDVGAIADALRREQGIKSIGLIGQSMGGLVSTVAAARFKKVSAIILLSGGVDIRSHWSSMKKHIKQYISVGRVAHRMMKRDIGGIPWWTLGKPVKTYKGMMHAPSAMDHAKEVKIPLLSIHGARDVFVPFESAKRLYEAVASENKELMVLDGDHDLCATHFKQAAPVVLEFFGRWL